MPEALNDGSPPSAVTPPPGGIPAAAAGTTNEPANPAGTPSDSDKERNWRNLQSDRDYWRDRATTLETTPSRGAAPTPTPEPPAPTKKTLADFAFNDVAYGDYLREEVTREAVETTRKTMAEERERESAEARARDFETHAAAFSKANPTYFEAVRNPRFVQSPALIAEIMEAGKDGPALALYLANNLDETGKLNRMTPVQVAREVVKLQTKLSAQRAALSNQIPAGGSPPADPPATLGGTGDAGVDKKDPAKMSDEDWWKNRERANKRKK